jgi:hypothetical protein
MTRRTRGNLCSIILISSFAFAADPPPATANSDDNYRKLRSAALAESFFVENLELKRDTATIRLKQGEIAFAGPQLGKVTLAVFSGTGEIVVEPVSFMEKEHIQRFQKSDKFTETFQRVVFVFTDATYDEVRKQGKARTPDAKLSTILSDFRDRQRKRVERPRSNMEAQMMSGTVDNIDAEVLSALYNPARPSMFYAYMRGEKYKDLRFILRGLGALPDLPSPEEVALLNIDPGEGRDGLLYHSHLRAEVESTGFSTIEDKRPVQSEKAEIVSDIEGNRHLSATAKIELTGLIAGERVVKFGLLSDLRVSSVKDAAGAELNVIQEEKDKDGALYVILPKGLKKGEKTMVTIAYRGDKVISDAGGGSLYVVARTSWYPSLNSFQDRTIFDLTFRAPKKYTVVASGKKVKEWKEGNLICTEWQSESPHGVAGFNAGIYKAKSIDDSKSGIHIDGFATTQLPDYLHDVEGTDAIAPSSLLDRAMSQAQVSMNIFTYYFGPLPYKRIAITQQPQFSFGQSWPELVYLPLAAFLDSTTRYQMFGTIDRSLTAFVDEVTAHEVSHQWWGHAVGWGSYRDQWLSEGMATFSASLFLQNTEKTSKKYLEYWEQARKSLTNKNEFGIRSIDAGPIYMAWRVETDKTAGASRDLMYLKGAYVIHMLRMMMQDSKTGDADFIAMMKDFVQTHKDRNASLASFASVVNRHAKPYMKIAETGAMEWFFYQWVLGKEVPRYTFNYTLEPQGDKATLKATIQQSEVSANFAMPVPIYLETDGRQIRLGRILMVGNQTKPIEVALPFKPTRVSINAFHDILELK